MSSQEKQDSTYIKKRDRIIKKGIDAYFKKDTIVLKESTQELLLFFNTHNDSISLAKYYQYKALYHRLDFKQDSAYYYYSLSTKISKSLKDSLNVGRRLLSIGFIQKEINNFIGAQLSLNESLTYLEPIKSYKYLTSVYNLLGLIYSRTCNFEQSRENLKKSLKINKKNKNEDDRYSSYLFIYNNIGLSYQLENKQKEAIKYFKKGLTYYDLNKKKTIHYALLLENLACSYFKLGNTSKEIINLHFEALEINKSENNLSFLCTNYINISFYFNAVKKKHEAKRYAIKALKYSKKSHNNKRWLEALTNLSNLSKGEESKKYLQEYIQLNDSLLKKERAITNQFAKIKFENDKREKENSILQLENEKKQQQINKQKQQNILFGLFGVISLLALAISFLVFSFRKKKLILSTELKNIKAKEEERTRISKELHDGILGKLFGIRLGLGFVNLKSEDKEQLKYNQYLNELQHVEKEIREVSHQLTIDTEHKDFSLLITELIKEKSSIGSFKYSIQINPSINWLFLQHKLKINLHRIIHETLNNIIKHAAAKNVIVTIDKDSDTIITSIIDDGVGFNKEKIIDGIGIKNIKLRVNDLKGNININSQQGKGTSFLITIPL